MKKNKPSKRHSKIWQLLLYVIDQTPKSQAAFLNLKTVCETHLKGRYRIKVIDLESTPSSPRGPRSWRSPPSSASCRARCGPS